MMKLKSVLLALTLAASLASCGVHEYPEGLAEPVEVALNLDFATDMPQFLVMDYAVRSMASDFDVRYQVNAYPMIDGKYSNIASSHWTFTKDDISNLNNTVDIRLSGGKYKIMVWADYVTHGSSEDKYYSTADFANITHSGDYEGNNDYRDAFCGSIEVAVENDATEMVQGVVQMERPLAKFEVIADDVEEYTARYINQMKNNSKSDNVVNAPKLDYNKFHAEIVYVGYLPSVLDIFQNKPIDSVTGMKFAADLKMLNDNTVLIGFDYVMVNGKESSVVIGLNIYNEDNSLISSVNSITVPLKRSKLTTVRGKFLTNGASSGIGISPDFDGEFNVEIN